MLKMFKLLFLLIGLSMTLIACEPMEPTMFGVRQSQWNQLSQDQQGQVIAGYNQRRQIEQANEPFMSAIGAGELILMQHQH